MPYPAVDPQPDFPALEDEILARWAKDDTFQASIDQRDPGPGDPNAQVDNPGLELRIQSAVTQALDDRHAGHFGAQIERLGAAAADRDRAGRAESALAKCGSDPRFARAGPRTTWSTGQDVASLFGHVNLADESGRRHRGRR